MNPQIIAVGLIIIVAAGGIAVTQVTDFEVQEFSFIDSDSDCTWTTFESPNGETFSSKGELFTAYEQATGNSSSALKQQADFRVQNGVVQSRTCVVKSGGS